MTDAVIFVPPGAIDAGTARCLDYCAAKRYHVVGLVPGDWAAAERMLHDGTAAVIVVPSAHQLDPARETRVEVVPKRLNSRRRGGAGAARTSRYPARLTG